MSYSAGPGPLYEAAPLPEITALAIGVFDGVHLGHQKVIQSLSGAVAALTFEPHPLWIIAPERAPHRLTPAAKKATLLRSYGVKEVVVVRFDEALRQQTAVSFVRYLHRTFPNLKEVAIGEGWTFGLNREGTAARLAELGETYHFQVYAIPPVMRESAPVSSTRIREAIWQMRFAEADAMLGWPYAISGKVVHGDGRGRQLNFPTANLTDLEQLLPPPGVYALRVYVPTEEKVYPAVMNYGHRPTFATNTGPSLEVHLLNFNGDLYGLTLELFQFAWLREEITFSGVEALKQQLEKDVAQARLLLD